ncbi:MAG: DUF3575 domain-containing protein [Bacteroides sp.]|nr:DUF3575 domain-containing protein [Barnesiella sp.]MBD5369316.1 DUF3575 domain-containing protein [Bacteroides sp.]MDE5828788.1 DUF3575 domain-containing protein [Duncaniella sp.]
MRAVARGLIIIIAVVIGTLTADAQSVGIKTNLLSDVALSPNLGIEVKTAPKWTVDLSGSINAWTIDGRKWKHWLVQPEVRYWFCEAFSGHFVGAHLLGGQYNLGNLDLDFKFLGTDFSRLRDHRYEGWAVGAGIAYGYAWVLGRHWNLEAEIGVGYVYTEADKYTCAECGKAIARKIPHHYVGPTKAAINIVYLF